MPQAQKRKTSLTLDADALDDARALGLNVSAITDQALKNAVAQARRTQWLEQNAETFAAQAAWHDENGHPLSQIMAAPGGDTWND